MAKASTGPVGVLSPDFDWDALSANERQRIYYRNFPTEAFNRIKELEASNARLIALTTEVLAMAEEALRPPPSSRIIRARIVHPELIKWKRAFDAENKRVAKLDHAAASTANAARAANFKMALEDFVRGRVKQNPLLTAGELAAEVVPKSWAKRSKRGVDT